MKAKPLDARTLRRVSLSMRKRSKMLKRINAEPMKGNAIREGRFLELDMRADRLLQEARDIERKAKASKEKNRG